MFTNILFFLTIVGSLALFLYGIKMMSRSLQRISSAYQGKLLSNNNLKFNNAISKGIIITGIVQSSTAVVTLLLSFLNAGVLNLFQSVGILIGANIGTTVTTWIISLIGLKYHFTTFILPIMGISLPLLYFSEKRNRTWGEFVIGLGLILLGVEFLKEITTPIDNHFIILTSIVEYFKNMGHKTLFLIFFGSLFLTSILQSSSTVIAGIMVICYNGLLSYDNAIIGVLGANIGATIPTLFISRIATNPTKRLAIFHLLFNVIIVGISLIFFNPFIRYSQWLSSFFIGNDNFTNINMPLAIALYHSGINIFGALIVMPFKSYIVNILNKILPLGNNEAPDKRIHLFQTRFLNLNELSLIQASKEIAQYGINVELMFKLIPRYLIENKRPDYEKIRKKLLKSEEKADASEKEIEELLIRIASHELTEAGAKKVHSMHRIINEIESIADQCFLLERVINEKNKAEIWFSQEKRDKLHEIFLLVESALVAMNDNLSNEYRPGVLIKAEEIELRINEMRAKLINENKVELEKGIISNDIFNYFAEIVSHCEKIGDYILNINQAIASN